MLLYYCDHEPLPLPPEHKFPIAKYRMLRDALSARAGFGFLPAPPAEPAVIALAHNPGYVRGVLEGTLPVSAFRRIGFPWSPQMVRRTLCSAGGTLAATEDALRTGFGGTLAGGTHHAFHAEGSGFCVFNDIAIAIRKHRFARAAVIDLDVHQGDGTASLFQEDASVFTLSLHGANNFPFRKQRSRLDVALPDGTADEPYLQALGEVLPRVSDFRPEIIFYQSGVDSLATDKLGRLALTRQGLAVRDSMVFRMARAMNIPCVVVLGGGYSDPIELTVLAHEQTFVVAQEYFSETQNLTGI